MQEFRLFAVTFAIRRERKGPQLASQLLVRICK
jgi:hypothetical protein